MWRTRREVIGVATASVIGLAGCIFNSAGDAPSPSANDTDEPDTTPQGLADITVVNKGQATEDITLEAKQGGTVVFDRMCSLADSEERQFADPFKNDNSYVLTVVTGEGLSNDFEWTPEHDDESGVRVLIYSDRIEFEDIIS
jgi:hypothetical protein